MNNIGAPGTASTRHCTDAGYCNADVCDVVRMGSQSGYAVSKMVFSFGGGLANSVHVLSSHRVRASGRATGALPSAGQVDNCAPDTPCAFDFTPPATSFQARFYDGDDWTSMSSSIAEIDETFSSNGIASELTAMVTGNASSYVETSATIGGVYFEVAHGSSSFMDVMLDMDPPGYLRGGGWAGAQAQDVITYSITPDSDPQVNVTLYFGGGPSDSSASANRGTGLKLAGGTNCQGTFDGCGCFTPLITGTSDGVGGFVYVQYTVTASGGSTAPVNATWVGYASARGDSASHGGFVSNDLFSCATTFSSTACPDGSTAGTGEFSTLYAIHQSDTLDLGRPTTVILTRSATTLSGPECPNFGRSGDGDDLCSFSDYRALRQAIAAGSVPFSSASYIPTLDLEMDGDLDTSDQMTFESGSDNGSCCPADFNADGNKSVQDLFDFLAAQSAGDPSADADGTGTITINDIFVYTALYNGSSCN